MIKSNEIPFFFFFSHTNSKSYCPDVVFLSLFALSGTFAQFLTCLCSSFLFVCLCSSLMDLVLHTTLFLLSSLPFNLFTSFLSFILVDRVWAIGFKVCLSCVYKLRWKRDLVVSNDSLTVQLHFCSISHFSF